MYDPNCTVGCPFMYDGNPLNLRQCEKERDHKGQHVWHGVDGFYIKWTEKLVASPTNGTPDE